MARDTHNPHVKDLPKLLTGDEVMRAIGVTRKWPAAFLYRLRQKGLIRAIRVGGGYRYPEDSVRDLLRGEVA